MKVVSNRRVLELVAALALLALGQAKFIKRGRSHREEDAGWGLRRIANRGERRLTGEGDEKEKQDMLNFQISMSGLIKKEVGERYGADNVEGNITPLNIKKPGGKESLFKVNVQQKIDEILELPMVEVTLELEMITYSFALEKTPLRGAPERKCQLILNNFFFLVDQYISEISDVKGDMADMMTLVMPSPPRGGDRMLVELESRAPSRIQSLPIQSHIKMRALNLRKKRYTSRDKAVQASISRTLELLARPKKPAGARSLKSRDELPQELDPSSPKYLTNKKKIFSSGKLNSDLFMDLVVTDGINGGDEDMPNELTYRLSPSEGELGEVKCKMTKDQQGVTNYCSHPAMSWTFVLSFPTKRFVLMHLENHLKEMERDFELIHKLNHLRLWKDTGNDQMARQRVITELMQPVLLYFLFRQEFDNRTQGLTETNDGFRGQYLEYEHTDALNDDVWWMRLFDVQSKPRREILDNNITFNDYGEGFLLAYFTSTCFIRDKKLKMGLRQFPDDSMFNQHVLAVKYIDMLAEFVTRMMHLPVPTDYVTPFPVQSLIYPSQDAIPAMERKYVQYFGPKTTHDLVNSPPVQNFDDSMKYQAKLCPLVGIEYDDEIVSKSIMGKGPGYELRLGSRDRFRWMVDYCSFPVLLSGGEGEGERRLEDEREEGFLV